MEEYGKNLMLMTVLVLDDPTTTSGVTLMWSSTPVGETCSPLLS